MYKGYLIDLDGTAYVGNTPIKETITFVKKLKEKNIPFLFLTNNASKTPLEMAKKLNSMGYNIEKEHVYSSANATSRYIKENLSGKVFTIGTKSLIEILSEENQVTEVAHEADVVVVGYNDEVTYSDLAKASIAVSNGAKFISTNPDLVIPNESGNLPGNGTLTKVVEMTSNKSPIIIGKPNKIILDCAIQTMGLNYCDVALIGDNYNTDIMCGISNGLDTIHVETGVSSREDVLKEEKLPTHFISDLSEWDL